MQGKRSRSRTVSALDELPQAVGGQKERLRIDVEECWTPGDLSSGENSPSTSGNVSASDSAYGTMEDDGDSLDSVRAWRKGRSSLRRNRRRTGRSRSVGDSWAPPAREDDVFAADVDYFFDDSSEDSSGPSTPSTGESSRRSSPEPSECEFDLRLAAPKFSPPRTPRASNLALVASPTSSFLARRHTVPRRRKARPPTVTFALSPPPPLEPPTPSSSALAVLGTTRLPTPSPPPSSDAPRTLSPISLTTGALTLLLSLPSEFVSIPLLPASPVHLLHPRSHLLLEYTNALFSPFLVTKSPSALALCLANLSSLKSLEDDEATNGTTNIIQVGAIAFLWTAIIGVRVALAFLFGRALGWAHPSLFSTDAIHEVGSGLAPLLLALYIVRAYRQPSTAPGPLSFQVGLLAANFSTPIEQGGAGMWWGISAILVGVLACAFAWCYTALSSLLATRPQTSGLSPFSKWSITRFAPLLSLLVIPFITAFNAEIEPTFDLDTSFANLHPRQPWLLTVLLMTAPRPGDPEFLLRTVESWLGAMPDPAPIAITVNDPLVANRSTVPTGDRLRMIVYTHFRDHQQFDAAQRFFATSPLYASKANHYIEWHRDPRGTANRLDQRLHVARGLQYASRSGGDSAYVLLTEDDFPLCPDREGKAGWSKTWEGLKSALVATNLAMPDSPSLVTGGSPSYASQEATSGHCGLFVATGGSGLAIRGFVAAQLPALLLGEDDADGTKRDARAARGELRVKTEGEGADTPDLVIQDCLRGKIPGCDVCAPGTGQFPRGSVRNPRGALGDRWGKSGLAGTRTLMQHHLGYNASTLPGRKYGKEEWACGWRQPFNGEPDVFIV